MDKIGSHPKMNGRVQTLEQKVLASLFLLGNKTSYIVASDKFSMSKGSLYLTLKNFCQVSVVLFIAASAAKYVMFLTFFLSRTSVLAQWLACSPRSSQWMLFCIQVNLKH